MGCKEFFPYLLRPPGLGIPSFSAPVEGGETLAKIWFKQTFGSKRSSLYSKLVNTKPKVVLFGVPSDSGGGIKRGAAYGPIGVRQSLYKQNKFLTLLKGGEILDLGDLYVNPHLLDQSILRTQSIRHIQDKMYPAASPRLRHALPIAPLDQIYFLVDHLLQEFPKLHLFMIGGDHSVSYPFSKAVIERSNNKIGMIHFDAHTDLLPERLGISVCFGSWTYHTFKLLKQSGAIVQFGIRETSKTKKHWEKFGVKQFWPKDIKKIGLQKVINQTVHHFQSLGIKQLYITNDIDGTDLKEAPSTGTPSSGGLSSRFVLKVIKALGRYFIIRAADLCEVAPPLGPTPSAHKKTCRLGARYVLCSIEQLLKVQAVR